MAKTVVAERPEHFRTFRSYAQHQSRAKNKALCSIEQIGAGAALMRCQGLAEQICAELRATRPGRRDIGALAEFQVAIERAACELTEQLRPEINLKKELQRHG